MRFLISLCASITLLACAQTLHADDAWKGAIEIPGMTLEFSVVFAPDATSGGHTATMSIPMQGLEDGPLAEVTYAPDKAHFVLPVPNAQAVFDITFIPGADGAPASEGKGMMKQAGQTFPVSLQRVDDPTMLGPQRPQHPVPPFPYEVREVTFENPEAPGVTLAGTLTIPRSPGRHPALVMITGSGPQDRDETIFAHKPFWVIADHLTRKGIAVLRFDDRGTAESTGDFAQATVFEFASDARAAMKFLHSVEEVDRHRVGLLGHSEGGIVAPVVATRHDDVAFLVLLAPTGVTGDQVLIAQTNWLMEQGGATPEQVQRRRASFERLLAGVKDGKDIDALVPLMKEMLTIDAEVSGMDPSLMDDAQVRAFTEQLASRWMREFISFNPYEYLVKVNIPTLVLMCELDRQVFPSQNADPVREALTKAPLTDFEVRILPGLNHLFQHATTGGIAEYGTIEETFSPEALDIISNWLTNRFPQGR